MRYVIYVRGRLINDDASLLDVMIAYDDYCPNPNVLILFDFLIADHEYHLEESNGNRLLDVFVISG